MKIANYKRIDDAGDWESIDEVSDYMDQSDRWVRLTEPLEVEFTHLPPEDTIQPQVDALNRVKKKEFARHLTVVAEIDEKIGKLQAITHQPASVEKGLNLD